MRIRSASFPNLTLGHLTESHSLRQIEGMTLQVGKANNFKCCLVSCREHHAWRGARLECLLPTRRTKAPTIAWVEPRKSKLRTRRRKVVAARFGESQELCGYFDTHGVNADIFRTSFAAAGAEKTGRRVERANLDWLTEDVALLIGHGNPRKTCCDRLLDSGRGTRYYANE